MRVVVAQLRSEAFVVERHFHKGPLRGTRHQHGTRGTTARTRRRPRGSSFKKLGSRMSIAPLRVPVVLHLRPFDSTWPAQPRIAGGGEGPR